MRNQVGLRSGATGVLRCSSSGKPRPEKRPGCYWRAVGWCGVQSLTGLVPANDPGKTDPFSDVVDSH